MMIILGTVFVFVCCFVAAIMLQLLIAYLDERGDLKRKRKMRRRSERAELRDEGDRGIY